MCEQPLRRSGGLKCPWCQSGRRAAQSRPARGCAGAEREIGISPWAGRLHGAEPLPLSLRNRASEGHGVSHVPGEERRRPERRLRRREWAREPDLPIEPSDIRSDSRFALIRSAQRADCQGPAGPRQSFAACFFTTWRACQLREADREKRHAFASKKSRA